MGKTQFLIGKSTISMAKWEVDHGILWIMMEYGDVIMERNVFSWEAKTRTWDFSSKIWSITRV